MQVLAVVSDYNARKLASGAIPASTPASAQSEVQLPRAILADTMFSLLEYKPMSAKLRLLSSVANMTYLSDNVLHLLLSMQRELFLLFLGQTGQLSNCTVHRRVCTGALAVLAAGILDVLEAASTGLRIMQSSAEEVQDAVSGMYAILQMHGGFIAGEAGPKGREAVAAAAQAMLLLLQVTTASHPSILFWLYMAAALRAAQSKKAEFVDQFAGYHKSFTISFPCTLCRLELIIDVYLFFHVMKDGDKQHFPVGPDAGSSANLLYYTAI